MYRHAAPILIVAAIEPCLPFWLALGFRVTVTTPHGPRLGFAMLQRDQVVIMYQTVVSLAADLPGVAVPQGGITYLEVADLPAVSLALPADAVAVPLRTTYYGSQELFAREPGGHLIGFAQHE